MCDTNPLLIHCQFTANIHYELTHVSRHASVHPRRCAPSGARARERDMDKTKRQRSARSREVAPELEREQEFRPKSVYHYSYKRCRGSQVASHLLGMARSVGRTCPARTKVYYAVETRAFESKEERDAWVQGGHDCQRVRMERW